MNATVRAGAIACVLILSCVHAAAAQVVRGRLIDEQNNAIHGGFVLLLDSAGRRAASTLSGAAGVYQLSASPGNYRLRIERIGFATHETATFTLDSVRVFDVMLPQAAIELPSITGSATSRCNSRDRMAAAAATVWEEVRKVLTVTSWTQQQSSLQFRMLSLRQQVEPASGDVVAEEREIISGSTSGSPFTALSHDSLIAHGFIQTDGDGPPTYYAPDAELIMSQPFQQTHCFMAVTDKKKPDMVGLRFEPGRDAKKSKGSDIRGTIWIDRESYELRTLEFGYTELPDGAPASAAGGTLTFARLPGGMWIISGWSMRAPVVQKGKARFAAPGGGTFIRDQMSVVAIQRIEQQVLSASIDGVAVYPAPKKIR